MLKEGLHWWFGLFAFGVFTLAFIHAKSWRLILILCGFFGLILFRLSINFEFDLPNGVYKIVDVTKTKENRQTFIGVSDQKVLFNLKKNHFEEQFYIGDLIYCTSKRFPVNDPKTLADFNYKQYLAQKGIRETVNSSFDEIKVLSRDSSNIYFLAQRFKQSIIQQLLNTNKVGDATKGILIALITGDKSFLDVNDKKLFRETGVIHVLAISGLHVGVFYLTLSLIIFKLIKCPQKLGLLLIVILLFGYAFLTGLSPSVIRATLMFTFIQIGKTFHKEVSTLNVVLFTAALMLFWEPDLLFDVGFQLSFSAVIGIVIVLQHSFLSSIQPNKKLKWIWSLFLVNLSAFVFTSPVLIFHFGFMNLTSLWASFLVVPLISIAMYLGMLTVVFSFIDSVGSFFLQVFDLVYQIVKVCLDVIQERLFIKFALYFDVFMVLVVFSFLLCLFLKKRNFLWLSVVFFSFSLIIGSNDKLEVLNKNKYCELKIRKEVFRLNKGDGLLINGCSFLFEKEGRLIMAVEHQMDTIELNVNKYQCINLNN